VTREDHLQVWETEVAALAARLREGRSVVGNTAKINLAIDSLDTAQDFLRLEQGLPVINHPHLDIPSWP
jgi:putative heme iron utilization protein